MALYNGIWLSNIIGSEDYDSLICKVYNSLIDLKYEYNNFKYWYFNKVVPDIRSGKRDIFITFNNESISGVLITKDDTEKKICTLRVQPIYQRQGIGKVLFEQAFEKLQIDKPIITVSQRRQTKFNKILDYFGFELACSVIHYYGYGSIENCYNGILESKTLVNSVPSDNGIVLACRY